MIKISLLLTLGLLSQQCTGQKKSKATTTQNNTKVSQTAIEKIELEEMTRGTRKSLVITPTSKNISVNDAARKGSHSSAEWTNIVRAAESIDLAKISSYEAPTTDRFHDGALAATVKIHKNGKVYTSQTFDSGRPPKELASLYKLLSPSINQ